MLLPPHGTITPAFQHTYHTNHTTPPCLWVFAWGFLSSGFFSHPASACHRTPCPSRFSSDLIFPTGSPGLPISGQWLMCSRSQSWSNAVLPWFQDRIPASAACFLFPHHQEVPFLSLGHGLHLLFFLFSLARKVSVLLIFLKINKTLPFVDFLYVLLFCFFDFCSAFYCFFCLPWV